MQQKDRIVSALVSYLSGRLSVVFSIYSLPSLSYRKTRRCFDCDRDAVVDGDKGVYRTAKAEYRVLALDT